MDQQKPSKKREQQEEHIPVKRVIYIDIDDEITDIYERIKRLKMDDIYLVVPARAVLFSSIVHLKILKRKLHDLGKNISIITNDRIGIHLAKQAKVPIYDRISPVKDTEEEASTSSTDISPVKAVSNPHDNETPKRLRDRKVSIFEIVQKAKGKTFSFQKAFQRKRLTFFSVHRKTVTVLTLFSILILLAISYVTLPGATIYLTPNSNVIEISVNITLADANLNAYELSLRPSHMLASYPVSTTIKKSFQYFATGQIFTGENAVGRITIINEAPYDWPLVAQTRFQTEDGLVFRVTEDVTVPRSTAEGFGTIESTVRADDFDAYGQVIGEKGNIAPTSFFIPGLRESSQKKLYAKSSEAFTGGKTLVTNIVSEKDVLAAEAKAKNDIRSLVLPELQKYVVSMNAANDTDFHLLEHDLAITTSEPRIIIPSDLAGKSLETFDVNAEMDVSGIAYNRNEFLNILKAELTKNKSPEKRLVTIDEASVFYRIVDINEGARKIKITATIKGIEEYEIDPEEPNGSRLMKKITEHIQGKNKEEARDYIQNLPEVNKVQIKSWPVWAPTLPKVAHNIDITVLHEGESID